MAGVTGFAVSLCLILFATQGVKGVPDASGRVLDFIQEAIPENLFDGSYTDKILDGLSSLRVSPGDLSASRVKDLLPELDSGALLNTDFVSAVKEHFGKNIDFTLDRVSGLFDGDQSELSDFLRSPEGSFEHHFGLTEKCSGPGFVCGKKIPDACIGPTYSFVMDGGVCVIDEYSGEVVCSRPSISLVKIPATCNLKYDSSTTVLGHSCVAKKEFGTKVTKTIGKKGRTLNIGAGDPYQFLGFEDLHFDIGHFFKDL